MENKKIEKYAVVSFKEGGGVSVIPKIWLLNKNITYWPKNSKNLRTLIIKAGEANIDWPTFKIERIYGFYDNYDDALCQEKEAAKSSESEYEDRGPGKRKYKAKEMYSPPPSFASTSTPEREAEESEPEERESEEANKLSQALLQDILYVDENVENGLTLRSLFNDPIKINETAHHSNEQQQVPATNIQPEQTENIQPEPDEEPNTNKDILRKLDDIHSTLKFILLRFNSLEADLGQKKENDVDFSDIPPLPMNTIEELLNLEERAKDAEFKKKMGLKLLQVSGKNENDFARRGLACLFSNQLGALCSWTGQKNNLRVKDLDIIAILKDAVQRVFHNCTDKNFEIVVMEWFRHAAQRLKREG